MENNTEQNLQLKWWQRLLNWFVGLFGGTPPYTNDQETENRSARPTQNQPENNTLLDSQSFVQPGDNQPITDERDNRLNEFDIKYLARAFDNQHIHTRIAGTSKIHTRRLPHPIFEQLNIVAQSVHTYEATDHKNLQTTKFQILTNNGTLLKEIDISGHSSILGPTGDNGQFFVDQELLNSLNTSIPSAPPASFDTSQQRRNSNPRTTTDISQNNQFNPNDLTEEDCVKIFNEANATSRNNKVVNNTFSYNINDVDIGQYTARLDIQKGESGNPGMTTIVITPSSSGSAKEIYIVDHTVQFNPTSNTLTFNRIQEMHQPSEQNSTTVSIPSSNLNLTYDPEAQKCPICFMIFTEVMKPVDREDHVNEHYRE